MRLPLGDLILLGSTLLQPISGVVCTEVNGVKMGCAIGMAAMAGGYVDSSLHSESAWFVNDEKFIRDYRMAETLHQLPCGCGGHALFQLANSIMHLFDTHVMHSEQGWTQWTLEQLADWVNRQQPKALPAYVEEEAPCPQTLMATT